MYELRKENRSESDLRSCKESPEKILRLQLNLNRHDLCNTGAMLYQLSYEASLEAGRKQVNLYPYSDVSL